MSTREPVHIPSVVVFDEASWHFSMLLGRQAGGRREAKRVEDGNEEAS